MEPKIKTLPPTCFEIIALYSVCCCSLSVWRRSFLKKGTPVTYFCPALDQTLDGSGRKTTTLVRDFKYFIHTKFHQNPSSCSGEEVENVNSLTDGRTDVGQRMITKGHWSLWLLYPKTLQIILVCRHLAGGSTRQRNCHESGLCRPRNRKQLSVTFSLYHNILQYRLTIFLRLEQ